MTGELGIDRRTASPRPRFERPYVAYVILVLTTANIFNYMDRMAMSVLLPSVKRDLALTDGQLGILVGIAFSLFYAVCGIPLASLADRGHRRSVIAGALAVWSVMTALCGWAQNFLQLLAARVGAGAGEAGCVAPAQSLICDYVEPRKRATAFTVLSFGVVLGTMLGLGLAGLLAARIGWRWTFVAFALPGFLFAFVVRFTVQEPVQGATEDRPIDAAGPRLHIAIATLSKNAAYRRVVLFFVLNGFAQLGIMQWLPSLLVRSFELRLDYAGVMLGVAVGAGSASGLVIGGFIAHRFEREGIKYPLLIAACSLLASAPVALGAIFAPSAPSALGLILLVLLLWYVPAGSVTAALYSVVRPDMRSVAGALTIFLTSIIGFGMGPTSVGLLSDYLARRTGQDSLAIALLLPVAALVPAAILLARIARSDPGAATASPIAFRA